MAELVKQGKLPPLEERLPIAADVLVIPPNDEIGVYGGFMRRTAHYLPGYGGLIEGGCVRMGPSGIDRIPGICKEYSISTDGRTHTFTLRQGARWSDGEPLTIEDFRMAWEDYNLNPEYLPVMDRTYTDKVTGNDVAFNVVDDLNWTLTFDTANFSPLEEKGNRLGYCAGGVDECYYVASHVAKTFHPKFAAPADLQKMMDDNEVENWVQLHKKILVPHIVPAERISEVPMMGPWIKVHKGDSDQRHERNPYFPAVDPEGNQLPYLDGLIDVKMESREVAAFRSMGGELDHGSHSLKLSEIPLYQSNMEQGDYSMYMWLSAGGCDACFTFNQTYNEDPELGMWLRTPDFRRAISIGIDRDTINETIVLGLGVGQNRIPHPSTPFYPGAEWELLDATLQIDRANQLLDDLGLVDTDGDGLRDRLDGKGNLELYFETSGDFYDIIELMQPMWAKIGLKLNVKDGGTSGKQVSLNKQYFQMINSLYEANPWGAWWTRMVASYNAVGVGPSIGRYNFSRGGDPEAMQPTGPDPAWLPLAPEGTFPADATPASPGSKYAGKMQEMYALWNDGHGLAGHDPQRIENGKQIYIKNVEEFYTVNILSFSGHFTRSLHIKRNNFRNVPTNHFPATDSRYLSAHSFEGGIDNINNPGNKSKLYKSYSFLK
jgi:peptide/nickel transport system substrate-binding protein